MMIQTQKLISVCHKHNNCDEGDWYSNLYISKKFRVCIPVSYLYQEQYAVLRIRAIEQLYLFQSGVGIFIDKLHSLTKSEDADRALYFGGTSSGISIE